MAKGRSGQRTLKLPQNSVIVKTPKKPTVDDLNRKIKTIVKQTKEGFQWITLNRFYQTSISAPFAQFNLMDYVNSRLVFGTSADDVTANKWYHSSIDLDIVMTLGNELANVCCTCYIVSLKDDASALYDKATGLLTLTAVTHYAGNNAIGDQYQPFLNPALFNIHYSKRITLGNNNQAVTSSTAVGYANKSLCSYARFHHKLQVGKTVYNPNGNVQQLTCSQDPSQQYYLLIFNDNLSSDLEYPQINVNTISHIKVPT